MYTYCRMTCLILYIVWIVLVYYVRNYLVSQSFGLNHCRYRRNDEMEIIVAGAAGSGRSWAIRKRAAMRPPPHPASCAEEAAMIKLTNLKLVLHFVPQPAAGASGAEPAPAQRPHPFFLFC